MDKSELKALLDKVADGRTGAAEALAQIQSAPVADIGYAQLDLARGVRQGAGEVVFGQGKTAAQVAGIVDALVAAGQRHVLVTRLDPQKAAKARALMTCDASWDYREDACLAVAGGMPEPSGNGRIVVACAVTAEFLGNRVERVWDVGVAGLHRLLAHAEVLARAQVVIAVAGMEGALASVIGGLVSCPVIAVPTSVGYGASLGGIAALLSMLNSCASGVRVVNIDNGFGAGYQASLINHLSGRD